MNTTIINLTPHAITAGGLLFPPSGETARVTATRAPYGTLNGVPVFRPLMGPVEGLPAPQAGVIFTVSAMVRTHPACSERGDLVSPGVLQRDAAGNVIGADGFDCNLNYGEDEA